MKAAGAGYVRFDAPWSALEPNPPALGLAGVEVRTPSASHLCAGGGATLRPPG